MNSRLQRALTKLAAPNETKQLGLQARIKLVRSQKHGHAAWFTPQEIEAVDADRRHMKRSCMVTLAVLPVCVVLWSWDFSFAPGPTLIACGLGTLGIVFSVSTWRTINDHLRTMRQQQTRAHHSFFQRPEDQEQ